VPIANKPILYYGLEALRDAGITQIGIVVSGPNGEIEQTLKDGSLFGVQLSYIVQPEPLGLAHAVKISREFLQEEPFVMYLGDNLLQGGIASVVRDYKQNGADAQILLTRVKNPQDFGVAELDSAGTVIRLVEKPKQPQSDLALVGVYLFNNSIWEAVENIRPSFRNELEITDAIQYLIDGKKRVVSHIVTGWWKDTGKLEDILEANRVVLEDLEPRNDGQLEDSEIIGRVVVEKGARVVRSTVRGPAIIGERTLVEDSYVGPYTSIYFDSIIRRVELECSIVLENCRIEDVGTRIEESLIGQNVKVGSSERKPKAIRLMLGDSSVVELV